MKLKPVGKSYGSIGHLIGSRLEHSHAKYQTGKVAGVDMCVQQGTNDICTKKARPGDTVIVQEKLDGSNVAVANVDGELVSITRAGKVASGSRYEHHRMFSAWVRENADDFGFLEPGERVCGEWLALAHGTIYKLPHGPFVAFDIIDERRRVRTPDDPAGVRVPRVTFDEFSHRCRHLPMPHLVHTGGAISVEDALCRLDPSTHGAQEKIEGCVWRVERDGRVDILAKYVRPDKVDGKYLPEVSGAEAIWNWRLPSWTSPTERTPE